jgi:JmjC domain, hydroxylase
VPILEAHIIQLQGLLHLTKELSGDCSTETSSSQIETQTAGESSCCDGGNVNEISTTHSPSPPSSQILHIRGQHIQQRQKKQQVLLQPTLEEWNNFPSLIERAIRQGADDQGFFICELPESVRKETDADALLRKISDGTIRKMGHGSKFTLAYRPSFCDIYTSGLTLGQSLKPSLEILKRDENLSSGMPHFNHFFQQCSKMPKHRTTRLPTAKNMEYHVDINAATKDERRTLGLPAKSAIWPLQGDELRNTRCGYPGTHSPFVYISPDNYSIFGFHREDYDTMAINHLHAGSAKIWLIVAPHHAERFEQAVQEEALSIGKNVKLECSQFIRHLAIMVTEEFLIDKNIDFESVNQYPGHTIITLPKAYHQGINTGPNVAEAVNYAPPGWTIDDRYRSCMPRCSGHVAPMPREGMSRRDLLTEQLWDGQRDPLRPLVEDGGEEQEREREDEDPNINTNEDEVGGEETNRTEGVDEAEGEAEGEETNTTEGVKIRAVQAVRRRSRPIRILQGPANGAQSLATRHQSLGRGSPPKKLKATPHWDLRQEMESHRMAWAKWDDNKEKEQHATGNKTRVPKAVGILSSLISTIVTAKASVVHCNLMVAMVLAIASPYAFKALKDAIRFYKKTDVISFPTSSAGNPKALFNCLDELEISGNLNCFQRRLALARLSDHYNTACQHQARRVVTKHDKANAYVTMIEEIWGVSYPTTLGCLKLNQSGLIESNEPEAAEWNTCKKRLVSKLTLGRRWLNLANQFGFSCLFLIASDWHPHEDCVALSDTV